MKLFANQLYSSCQYMVGQKKHLVLVLRQIYWKKIEESNHNSLSLFILFSLLVTYRNLPIRNITARSNSETTLKQMNNENGSVRIIKRPENNVANISIHPDRFPSAKNKIVLKCTIYRLNTTPEFIKIIISCKAKAENFTYASLHNN